MTMASAIHSAISGLRAAGLASDIVSSNIANALTPGHARREIALTSAGDTGGVQITGIVRQADPALTQVRRMTDAAMEGARVEADFAARLGALLADPEVPESPGAALVAFDAALVIAASAPESQARLDRVALTAGELASAVAGAGRTLSDLRGGADRAIAGEVGQLNTLLEQVRDLTTRIVTLTVSGADASGLTDQRQAVIDRINVIAPVREIARDHGGIALYTQGGAILLDGAAARIGFTPANAVLPGMSVEHGALSGLTLNGSALPLSTGTNPLRGGTLSAHLAVRDDLAVSAQADLDALARSLIDRFAGPSVDATLGPGEQGLFIAAGPADAPGLSERLRIDPRVDGASWRLRDGLNAAAPGPAGDAGLIRAMTAALATVGAPPAGSFAGTPLSMGGMIGELATSAGLRRDLADQKASFATTARDHALAAETGRAGVDTDAELSNLMLIERAYAANARVLQTLDDMMQTLLRL